MIDLKIRKRDCSATSAKGGQFESAGTDQFVWHVLVQCYLNSTIAKFLFVNKFADVC